MPSGGGSGTDWSDAIRTAAAIIGALVALSAISGAIRSAIRRTLARRWDAKRKLYRLAANYQVEFFRSVLGAPALKSTTDGLTEWIWVDDLFYVQAVADADETVQRWTVTTRRKRFRPRFVAASSSSQPVPIKLNSTRFATLGPYGLHHVSCSLGARRFWYIEDFYVGNPGNYQSFFAAASDSAYRLMDMNHVSGVAGALMRPHPDKPLGWRPQVPIEDILGHDVVREFRAASAPNTYGESAPGVKADDPFGIGPDQDVVRVVERPTRSDLRRGQRRLRRGGLLNPRPPTKLG